MPARSIHLLRSSLAAAALVALSAGVFPAPSARADEPPRVRTARKNRAPSIKEIFESAKVPYPPRSLLLRAFKADDTLELWAEPRRGEPFVLLKTYPICARSGDLGPKRREGDGQVPEGFYEISGFNPTSNFHLSLRVSYPNESDRIAGRGGRLGGDIFIHGSCVTIGCIPIEDERIEELYVIAADAKAAGGRIHVHIFPGRLDDAGLERLKKEARPPELVSFWESLRPGFAIFEEKRTLPKIGVDAKGRYTFR